MDVSQAQAAKLIASQNLRIQMCKVEIAQFEDQLADIDLIVSVGGSPIMSREMVERLLTEPRSKLAGLESELASLQIALGNV